MPEQTDGEIESHPGRGHAWQRWAVAVVAVLVVVGGLAGALAFSNRSESDAPATALAAPMFVDATIDAGLDHVYDGDFDFFVGGGVAAFDCDGDGFTDLFFAGGAEPAALYRNRSRQGGELRFTREGSESTDLTGVTGAYPLDIDSDGVADLVVLRHGQNQVLRGTGECHFEPVSEQLGLDGGDHWTTAFSATWEGPNDLPTMAFGNYLAPDRRSCADSQLVRPLASGEGYGAAESIAPGYCTLSMLFSDWGRSGQRDLRFTNDRHYYRDGQEQLWKMIPDEQPEEYVAADGWRALQIWGMGIASRDLSGDGRPEVFLTSQGDNKLQTLADASGRPTYRDIALQQGATAQRPHAGGDVLPSTAWHPEFDDVNNDGFVDLFITKGNVEAQTDHADRDPSNLLLGQPDGTFIEAAEEAGILGYERSRGAAVTDLNLDGLLDLVVVNRRSTPTLWHNVGGGAEDGSEQMGHWLAVRLGQSAPNVDAVGAWLEVRAGEVTSEHEVTIGGGHASGQLGWIHAGLGHETTAEVRVQWQDGEVGPWMTVDADQFVTIDRGDPEPRAWSPDGSDR